MKVLHKAASRGSADYDWLKTNYSFSFANYYDPSRIHFGMLRVLNDDYIEGGMGFGTHPHDNMEIITIPLTGSLQHKDSMGTTSVITSGEVQIMSAGKGVTHSEFNASQTEPVTLLQIWIFPKERNIEPRYDQRKFDEADRQNKFQVVVSPEKNGNSMWINQDAYISLADIDEGKSLTYQVKKAGNGVYFFVLDGELIVDDEKLEKRDALGISEKESYNIKASKASKLLALEVPMK